MKRLCVNVILRFKSSLEKIAEISTEIKDKVLYYEVHQNEIAEAHHKGKPANIVWCHFGYDEDDMVDSNFFCFTTWVDDLQDKEVWYKNKQDAKWVRGVYIESNSTYDVVKSFKDSKIDKNEFVSLTREYTTKIISVAEKYIKVFREYLNKTINEDQLIETLEPFNNEISLWYFKQTELPIAPNELHKWSFTHSKLCSTIHDFSLYYNKSNLSSWSTENRKWLMKNSLKRYEEELEELKEQDKILENLP